MDKEDVFRDCEFVLSDASFGDPGKVDILLEDGERLYITFHLPMKIIWYTYWMFGPPLHRSRKL